MYDLTPEAYDALREGSCEICGDKFDDITKMHIDHNHLTGQVRGALCQTCNVGMSGLKDSPAVILAAALYLGQKDTMHRKFIYEMMLAAAETMRISLEDDSVGGV